MGQDQSQYLSSAGVDQRQIPQRQRAKARTTKPHKLPAEQRTDAFMKHTEAPNRIRPIREVEKKKFKEEEELYGDFDVKFLAKKKKPKEVFEEVKVMDLPLQQYEEPESSSSSEEDVGMFHHEVKDMGSEDMSLTSPAAHPVAIDGEAAVGKELRLRDLSPYQREFPIIRVEWYIGLHVGDMETWEVQYAQQQSTLTQAFLIPAAAVGKYISARAYRNVENQLRETEFLREEEERGGAYDAHIGERGATALHKAPEKFLRVCSSSTAGPVLLADAWAYVILKALSKGAFSCACLVRDIINEGELQPLDGNKVSRNARKCPGTLLIEEGEFDVSYTLPMSEKKEATSALTKAAGLLNLTAAANEKSSEQQGQLQRISAPLVYVHVRPSKAPQTIVAVLQPPQPQQQQREGERKAKEPQILRLDVDPAIGRDVVLYLILAFQAADAEGTLRRREKWSSAAANGDFTPVKLLIQEHLEQLCTEKVTAVPAFVKMVTTPWQILQANRDRDID